MEIEMNVGIAPGLCSLHIVLEGLAEPGGLSSSPGASIYQTDFTLPPEGAHSFQTPSCPELRTPRQNGIPPLE